MTGMEWSRKFWEEIAAPDFDRTFPRLRDEVAAGLVGNGSECFGFDDELSTDHDWGTDFFLWVTEDAADAIPALTRWKAALLAAHPEYPRRKATELGAHTGVMTCGDFYRQMTGFPQGPQTVREWFAVPVEQLAMAVNGQVFRDGAGTFSAIRRHLAEDCPEDLRRKRIAARCMMLAQTGQYNLGRCLKRGHTVSAFTTVGKFVDEAIGLVFLLNRAYKPYYKWQFPAMEKLPLLAGEAGPLLERLTAAGDWNARQECVDALCALFAAELRKEGLSDAMDWFLAAHGQAVQATVRDPLLSQLPPQVG